jgi:tRNA dimethylallyltransferase
MNKIIVILGPTSSGKSDIAIMLAKKFNGEIISADSRQIFRGMDIGTGKVIGSLASKGKLSFLLSEDIPHYMIDIVSPRTEYNVAKFKRQAEKIIADILQRGKLPIICGGTGFWIQAIVDDVNFPAVLPDWTLRNRLEKLSTEKLFTMLRKFDSTRAKNIDSKNKVRLIRSIEICRAIGKVPALICHSDHSGAERRNLRAKANSKQLLMDTDFSTTLRFARDDKRKYDFLQIGLKLPREKLYASIEKRVLARFKQGMIDEVKNLHEHGLSWKKIQSFGLAYFWIPLFLRNKISKEYLFEKVIQVEKNYAKKQTTWFKRDKRIQWLENYSEIEKAAREFLN